MCFFVLSHYVVDFSTYLLIVGNCKPKQNQKNEWNFPLHHHELKFWRVVSNMMIFFFFFNMSVAICLHIACPSFLSCSLEVVQWGEVASSVALTTAYCIAFKVDMDSIVVVVVSDLQDFKELLVIWSAAKVVPDVYGGACINSSRDGAPSTRKSVEQIHLPHFPLCNKDLSDWLRLGGLYTTRKQRVKSRILIAEAAISTRLTVIGHSWGHFWGVCSKFNGDVTLSTANSVE